MSDVVKDENSFDQIVIEKKNSIKCIKNIKYIDGGFIWEDCYTVYDCFLVNVLDESGKIILRNIANRDHALKAGFVESYKDGNFYISEEARKLHEKQKPTYLFKPPPVWHLMNFPLREEIKRGTKSVSYVITSGKKYTFGVELETCDGYVAPHLYYNLNMKCTNDGSIRDDQGRKAYPSGDYIGKEYVTGVLKGDSGFMHLQRICNELAKRCKINKTCGLHVHIGSIIANKEFVVYSYRLALLLQDEIFSMLPSSRHNSVHCHKLANVPIEIKSNCSKDEYSIMMSHYYRGISKQVCKLPPSPEVNKKRTHPKGTRLGFDTSSERYAWINFLPCLTDTKGTGDPLLSSTLEFRCHNGTLNFNKVKNWVLICMAFVNYVDNRKRDIDKGNVNIEKLLKFSYPSSYRRLMEYVNERKERFCNKETSEFTEKLEYRKEKEKSIKNKSIKEIVM